MNKTFKTLALLSSITLVSACSHFHAKEVAKVEEKCPVVANLEKAATSNTATTAALKEAAVNAKDAAAKNRVNKLVKASEKLSKDIESNKKQCEVAMAKGEKPAVKAAAKKAAPAAKPADAAAPAKTEAK